MGQVDKLYFSILLTHNSLQFLYNLFIWKTWIEFESWFGIQNQKF